MNLAAAAPEPPWGTLVAAYFILIGLPSGLGLIAWWLSTTGPAGARLERYAQRASLTALGVVGVLLVADLGRPERFFLMLTRFDNLSSPIAVGAKLIAVKSGLLAVAVIGTHRAARLDLATDPPGALPPRTAQVAHTGIRVSLLAASFALAVYPAAVLSRTWVAPLASTSGAALLFLLTALLIGAGTAAAAAALAPRKAGLAPLARPLRRLLLILLGGYAIALALQALAAVGDPRLHAPTAELTSGGSAVAWWGGVVGLGIAAPAAVLTMFPSRRTVIAAAGLAAATGACITRYLLFSVAG